MPPMTSPRRIAIAGLGLMGGSLAHDLARSGLDVVAFDPDPATGRRALAGGVVAELAGDALEAFDSADLVVLATPVDVTPALLETLSRRPGDAIITDVGSTKRSTVAAAVAAGLGHRFVGAHPLAGDHRSGWVAARPGLYKEAAVFLCPAPGALPAALEGIAAFWESVGGRTHVLTPFEHDERMAWVSHLPQVVSSSLANALAATGRAPAELGPGGRDVTRLAASSPEVWAPICDSNADLLGAALDVLISELHEFRGALDGQGGHRLLPFLERAQGWSA